MRSTSARLVPMTGIVFVVLVVASSLLPGSLPKSTTTGASVIAYARHHTGSLDTSAVLIGVSLVFGLFFFGHLRAVLRQNGAAESLAAVSFGGAVLFAAGGGIAAGTSLALADHPRNLAPSAAQTLNLLGRDLPMILFVGAGILMLAAGLAIVRTGGLPVWLGWAGIVLGLVGVLPVGFIAILAAAIWTLAASIVLILRAGSEAIETAPAHAA